MSKTEGSPNWRGCAEHRSSCLYAILSSPMPSCQVCGQGTHSHSLAIAAKSLENHASVSYTHLDVYKRQQTIVASASEGLEITPDDVSWRFQPLLPRRNKTDEIRRATLAPIAAVHDRTEYRMGQDAPAFNPVARDVYKRQASSTGETRCTGLNCRNCWCLAARWQTFACAATTWCLCPPCRQET